MDPKSRLPLKYPHFFFAVVVVFFSSRHTFLLKISVWIVFPLLNSQPPWIRSLLNLLNPFSTSVEVVGVKTGSKLGSRFDASSVLTQFFTRSALVGLLCIWHAKLHMMIAMLDLLLFCLLCPSFNIF